MGPAAHQTPFRTLQPAVSVISYIIISYMIISYMIMLCQASVQQEKLDVQKARGQHDAEVQRHREHLADVNSQIDKCKVMTIGVQLLLRVSLVLQCNCKCNCEDEQIRVPAITV